ncbi:MAG: hypothetical protein PUG68_03640 [Lachnospiraceae bacterium]|jgi:hypothetical protein|nr:hypothetical protein [Lachnospiraceae bacterium]MDY2759551.1 hypothetical protein [Lachnospiraceae bacterium]
MTRPVAMIIKCEQCGRIHESAVITRRIDENGPLVNLFTCPYEDVVFIPEQERQRLIRLAKREERRAERQAG